jgi:type I restriction enzyme M protein
MLTGELRSKIDNVWNAFWAGGIANPIEVIEQITYLLFIRGLDEAHTREENKANRLGKRMERRIFPKGKDDVGKDGGIAYEDMRWSRLKNKDPATMFAIVSEHVFPFLRSMAEEGTAHATHMKGARFTIPTPALLAKVVDLLADIPMEDRDTKGDLYEYMLSKIATAGQNGQFRTPRHIIALMVEMTAPTPKDVICDPACGTCGFLVASGEYLRENHPKLFHEKESRDHFNEEMFHGFDFDGTMLRIGSMNMTLHGVEDPDIRYKDSLSQDHAGDEDRYSLMLANPPFAGSLDYETTAKDLLAIVKTKKTELLFMALFLKLLKPGGRAAVIVPDGVLFGSSTDARISGSLGGSPSPDSWGACSVAEKPSDFACLSSSARTSATSPIFRLSTNQGFVRRDLLRSRAPTCGGKASDFPAKVLDPERAAEIVIQRLRDAGFEIKPQSERR